MEYVYGKHAVTALMHSAPERIIKIYLLENKRLETSLPVTYLSRREMDGLCPHQNHQGMIAACHEPLTAYPESAIQTFIQPHGLWLVLDGVQDPHNLGACLRTADAAGVQAVIVPKDRSVGITPTVRKVACGAAETVPLIPVTNLARTLRELKAAGVWLFGADSEAKTPVYEADLRGAIGLVMGAEGKGLRRLTKAHCDNLVAIPLQGTVSSLNVAVATGICLFEAVRQRRG